MTLEAAADIINAVGVDNKDEAMKLFYWYCQEMNLDNRAYNLLANMCDIWPF